MVIGQTFMAGSIDPTAGSTAWALTSHGISEKLFTVNSAGVIVPHLAQSVEKMDSTMKIWKVTLKAGQKFSDGTAVTGKLVAEALALLNTQNSNARSTLGTMSVTHDGLTLTMTCTKATPVMDAVLAEWPFVVFYKPAADYIFTGPYKVSTFIKGDKIDLIPNPHYPRAAERSNLVIKKHANAHSLASGLEARQLDMAFHLDVDSAPKLRAMDNINVRSIAVDYQYMMFHNTRRTFHGMDDQKVRKALDLALDRKALQQTLKGGKATRSFFREYTPYYLPDTKNPVSDKLYGDKSGAEKLLDEAGWTKNVLTGIREKQGVALALHIVAYPQRPGLPKMLPLIKQQLAGLGIIVTTKVTSGASWDELDAIMAAKNYDLLLWAQNTLPAGDGAWFLNSFFHTNAGSNHAGLKSTAVDGHIDALATAEDGAARVAATEAAHKAVLEQVPVSILVTPEWHVGLSNRLTDYKLWGSDYYVVHADLGLAPTITTTTTTAAYRTGPLVIGQTSLAGSIDPTAGSTGWALTSHGIAEKLFSVNKAGVIVPQLALSVRKMDSSMKIWEVMLKAGKKFSDGTLVTGKLVADALTQLNTQNSNARSTLGKMTIAHDGLKLTITSEKATPAMEAVLAHWVFVVFHKPAGDYIFTGPFAVSKFTKGDKIDLIPNPHYYRASERSQLVIKKYTNAQSLASALEAKQLDMAVHLDVNDAPKLRAMKNINVKSFAVGYQYMMFHNTAKIVDQKVRKALDMALDRQALKQALKGGKGTRSFFPEKTPYYLQESKNPISQNLNADTSGAGKLLDEAGWVKNANGIRMKQSVPLTLKIVAYPQRAGLATMLPYVKQQLAALGITVTTTLTSGSSWDELDKIMADKNFDMLMWAQHTLPNGDPASFLNSFFRSDGGSNHAGLKNSAVDGLINALATAEEGTARVAATEAAHKAVLEQVPVSILVTPEWHVGLSNRLNSYELWDSDYYTVHADLGLPPLVTTSTSALAVSDGVDTSKLVGSAGFHVPGDVDAFISNSALTLAIKKGFGETIGVAVSKFTKFDLTKTSRRLDVQNEALARKLAAANVNVAYEVNLKGLANAAQISAQAKAIPKETLTAKVQGQLKSAGYTQTVEAKTFTVKNPVVTTTIPTASSAFGSQDALFVTTSMLPLVVLFFW
jgi:peptide/nickel transport system substrate-binding protein